MFNLQPDNEETRNLANSIRLNGKTIYEWKEDSVIFLQDKLDAELKNVRQNSENVALINKSDDLAGDNTYLTFDNTQLTADNTQLTADNTQLIADNTQKASTR